MWSWNAPNPAKRWRRRLRWWITKQPGAPATAGQKFLDGLAPLELANDTIVGDRVAALQLEQTGALVVTDGLVTAVQVMRYPAEVGEFLTYRLSIALQYRDNSYTVPLGEEQQAARDSCCDTIRARS